MPRLNAHDLEEDERWLAFVSLSLHNLIKRGLATCEIPPLPNERAAKTIERMIKDYPELFEFDPDLIELAVQSHMIRFGIRPNKQRILEQIGSGKTKH